MRAGKKKSASTARNPGRISRPPIAERTVQLFKMPHWVYWSLILWSQNRLLDGKKAALVDIYDEALAWFFKQEAKNGYSAYLAVPLRDAQKRSLWIDSWLLKRAGEIAERDGTLRNRVLYTAIILYLKKFGPIATREDIVRLTKLKSNSGQRGRPISPKR